MESLYATAVIYGWPILEAACVGVGIALAIAIVSSMILIIGMASIGFYARYIHGIDLTTLNRAAYLADKEILSRPAKAVAERLWYLEGAMRHQGIIPDETPPITWAKSPCGLHKGLGFNDISWENRINDEREQQQEETKTV